MAINVKLSETLVEQARIHGRHNHRSVPKQIEHWSMIGKMMEANPDLPFEMLQQILIGRAEQASEEYRFG